MQSTKGRAEHFIIVCRVVGHERREIQPFKYIEGDRFKTRKAAYRHADRARMRWQDNYTPYRDATMILVDTAELPMPITGRR